MPFFYGIDSLYIILVLPAILLSLFAQMKVSSTFSKYNKIRNTRQITGADVARRILDRNGLRHIIIEKTPGNLTDHYDPKARILRLSESVFSSTSIAALGVAAHECVMQFSMRKTMYRLKLVMQYIRLFAFHRR